MAARGPDYFEARAASVASATVRVRKEPFDLAHQIAEAAGVESNLTFGLTLIPCEQAGRFLDACRVRRVEVLGVEGFDLVDDGRRPDMGTILSLDDAGPDESVDEAQRFAADTCRAGLYYEFNLRRS